MAKIPTILEAGRADGKLIKTNSIYDDNQEKFLSDKIKEIDDNHNILNNKIESLTNTVNNNESDIENKLVQEKLRASNAENNLRETINNITKVNENTTTANIVTIDTIPNTSSSNVQQALNELFKNALFAGIATPTTNPGTPDGPVFYIATTSGVYANFNSIEVSKGELTILKWNNDTWTKSTIKPMTDFDSVFDANGNTLTDVIAEEKTAIIGTDRIADWAITYNKLQPEIKEVAEDVTYIENPEFIYVKKDADDRLLWWICKDGSVDWGKGVPAPIQEELRKLEQLIKYNTEGDESVAARVSANEASIVAINDAIVSVNEALDRKADGVYEDSPEYIKVEKDADERVINAITPDGTNYLSKANIDELFLDGGVLDNDAVKSRTYTDSPEFVDVVKDADDRVVEATKTDGTKVLAKVETTTMNANDIVTKRLNLSGEDVDTDVITSNKYEDNPEFIKVEKDADGRILSTTKPDGSHYIHNVESETIPTEFSNIDDIENRIEMSKDVDGRIISYRDSYGKLYENIGIETPTIDAEIVNADSLTLSKVGLTEFEQALKENGFTGGQGDWSTASTLHIPEPRCAMINITSADGKPYSWPTSKFVNNKVWVEFYDMQGNYFKKRAIHNAQGNSSMRFIKKNGAFDFCNDEWIGDDTFSIKFGDWVYQDSFHVKAYYTDFFKGASVVAYKIADQVEKSRGIFSDRPWKKGLLKDYVFGSDQANSAQINDMTLQLNNEAKCHPDGFPCIIYLDGAFYGIYAFCLKKHRDNYHMKKDVAEHIHLDGILYVGYLFGGNIDWRQFEIRNPKNLYYKEAQNGTYEYDADVAQAEIAGDDEVNAWIAAGQLPDGTEITSKIKKRLQTTAKVKNYVINLSQRVNQIKAASTTEEKKALFETYFDVDNLVDYEIVQMATGDTDGFGKNWQWTTYDGIKWWVNEYDKDMSFGGHFTGMFTQPTPTTGGWMGNDGNQPIGQLTSLYKTEIISRWKYLTENGVISVENFLGLFNDWLDRIGTDNFEKEYKKWPEAPCNRDDKVDTVHWARTNNIKYDTSLANYDNSKTYMPGESCFYDLKDGWSGQFICVSETTRNPPLTGIYTQAYPSLGYRDNIWRLTNYISQRLDKENEFINSL